MLLSIKDKLISHRVLPAVTFAHIEEALPVAEALLKGGLSIIEVALRTEIAFETISAIAKNFPEMTIGAGTILTPHQLQQAKDAGAAFGLSPSLNFAVLDEAVRSQFPFIPGVMTPSEIETAFGKGFSVLKLFPASAIGGVAFLKAIQGPYAHLNIQFIPMGGINTENMNDYLALPNVIAVGGSWLTKKKQHP